jgi:ribonuclease J
LQIIPLGGLGEFGMNVMLYRWRDECLLVDVGMMFPGAEHLGVEVVLPDLSFLEECGTIHAAILTHGHEDHVGALFHLVGRHDLPVYATPHTLELVRHRLREHEMLDACRLLPLPDSAPISLGPFVVESVVAAHSIPQARMIVLRTPVGLLVHTADFKFDPSPVDGQATDLARLAELGREGVLALLSDSTNADRPGFTPGERVCGQEIGRAISGRRGRVLVSTFASHVHRLQQLADLARAEGRKLALVGSSLENHAAMAERSGTLRIPPDLQVSAERAMGLPPHQALIAVSGTQGEPMSALARIAVDRHREVRVEPGDLVIHSARRIPGNEKSISRMINHLLRRGAEVVTAEDRPVHVSGHASSAELQLLIQLLRPRYLIPIHGEYRQLDAHARLAVNGGMESSRVRLADSGDLIELNEGSIDVVDAVHVGQVFVDADLGQLDWEILLDRRKIADGGIVMPVVAVDRESGAVGGTPEIVARGMGSAGDPTDEEILEQSRRVVSEALAEATREERTDEGLLRARIQSELKRFLRRRMQRPPLVIPVILEL